MLTEKRPTVWVVKEQVIRDEAGPVPMDYSPAMSYGDIRFITMTDLPKHPNSAIHEAWKIRVDQFCREYDDARDFIITTGQPAAIFMVGHRLGSYQKTPRLLIWKREEGKYQPAV